MHLIQYLAEFIFTTALFVHGFLFIPQVIKIWRYRSVEDLALITFLGFNVVQVSAVVHGYFVHDYPLMLGAGFSLITCGSVTLSIFVLRLTQKNPAK